MKKITKGQNTMKITLQKIFYIKKDKENKERVNLY